MIVLISGARKNVGDFLITDRVHKLLARFVDPEILVFNRFDDLREKTGIFNRSRAIVLGGGPAYTPNVFPGIYPFIRYYDEIKVPVIPMGLGWSGEQFDQPETFRFTDESLKYLREIHRKITYSSCRDVITYEILERNGLKNALMTGCPVWYELEKLGKTYAPRPISKIVITAGAGHKLVSQTLDLVRIVRSHFKNAEIFLTFHRGIFPGRNTPPRKGLAYTTMALLAQRYQVSVRNVSGSIDKIEFYKSCDLHIGFRVHAHLLFLANRIPSILINEDGRGVGMGKSLGLPILNFNQHGLNEKIDEWLTRYKDEGFQSFNHTFSRIDFTFEVMKQFLSSIN